jgi:DNA polymerase I-like protein with 3'-5' exonuclease and polymerase domains
MKEAASIFTERLDSMGWTAAEWQPVGHIHDEMQTMVRKDLANEAGRICVESIQAAGKHFRMRLPIDGEYKVGATWAETH